MDERNVISIEGYLIIFKRILFFSYWESLKKFLWNRFEAVMNGHNESVRNLNVRKLQVPVDSRPHYVGFLQHLF